MDPTGETHHTPASRKPEPDQLEDLVQEFSEPDSQVEPDSQLEDEEPTVGEHPLAQPTPEPPARYDPVPPSSSPAFQERKVKPQKKGKQEVAKDGAKRGGVEGIVVYALTQLALSYGAPAELLSFITEANIALLAGAATVLIRVAEAVIADGGSEADA